MNEGATSAVPRDDVFAIIFAAFQGRVAIVEAEVALWPLWPMAAKATRLEDGFDVALEVDRDVCGWWEFGDVD